jgi:hypothetical protein
MNIGMLWYDNDPKTTLEGRIGKAVKYYNAKYGKPPNCIFVNPKMINGIPPVLPGIELRMSRSVMYNHFWVGVAT